MIFDYPIILNLKNHLSITDIHNLSLTCKYYYGILNRIIKEIDLENLKNLEMLLIGILFSTKEFEKVDLRLLEYVKIYKQYYIKNELINLYDYDPNIDIKKIPSEIFEIFKNYHNNRDIKKLTFSNISNLQKYRFDITDIKNEFVSKLKLKFDYYHIHGQRIMEMYDEEKPELMSKLAKLNYIAKLKTNTMLYKLMDFDEKYLRECNLYYCKEYDCKELIKILNKIKIELLEEFYEGVFDLFSILSDYMNIYFYLKSENCNYNNFEEAFNDFFMHPFYNLLGKEEIKEIYTEIFFESFKKYPYEIYY